MRNFDDTLSGSLLFIRFKLHQWSATVKDKKLKREIEENKEADSGTHEARRHLCAPEFGAIRKLGNKIRNEIYKVSFSMANVANMDGEVWRVMPSLVYDAQKPKIQKMIREWSDLVSFQCETEDRWNGTIERDLKRQGKSANRGDYPSLEKLRNCFHIEFNIRPFSVSQTMLCDIFSEAAEDIDKAAEERAKEITENMIQESFERIHNPLKELVSAMRGEKQYFKDSTVVGIEEMVALMRGFNITNNPQITEILDDISNSLFGLDPKALRKSESDRERVANTAQGIVDKLESYF
jgi:hypothetical protein